MDAEIFLTMDEARDAMSLDLEHYGIQEETLEKIADLAGGRWPPRLKEAMEGGEDRLCQIIALLRELMNSPTTTDEVLCGALSLLFWADVRKANGQNGEEGVVVATELSDFICLHCGRCCTALDYSRSLNPDDMAMWRKAGRDDILARVGKDEEGYIIWINPETGEIDEPCPFLTHQNGRFLCAIHDVKPTTCREFPATRKHGFMTGCPGVELMMERESVGSKSKP